MSTTPTAPSTFTSQSNFLPILHAALESYKRKTKKNVAHPLLPSLQSCESPEGVLTVVREQVLAFSAHQNRDGGLTKWVVPTANVLYSFSETIGRVALAFLPAAKDASASRDNLIDISNHIEYFFRRLEMYTSVTLTTAMNDIIVEIMVEVLTFLAIVRKKAKPPKRGLIKKKY